MLSKKNGGACNPLFLRGFTLIELMITVALLTVLLAIAMPEMRTYMLNSSIRRTAESFAADITVARAEAIRTNIPVTFTVTSERTVEVGAGKIKSMKIDGKGPNWVAYAALPVETGGGVGVGSTDLRLVLARSNVKTTDSSEKPMVDMRHHIKGKSDGKAQFVFNGMGAIDSGAWNVFRFTKDDYNRNCTLDNSIRCLHVEISPTGSVRVCEPGRESSDMRACRKV